MTLASIGPLFLPSVDFLMPMSLSFIPKSVIYYFPINYIQQIISYILVNAFIFVDFLLFITILRHILNEMDILIDVSLKMGKFEELEILKNIVDEDNDAQTMTTTEKQFMSVLLDMQINENDHPKTTELVKVFFERHVTLIEVIEKARSFYLINILVWELTTFTTLIYIYLLFFHQDGVATVGFASGFVFLQYYVISNGGGNILSKEDEIARALYGSKWYFCGVKERKNLTLILMMTQKSNTLSAGGFGNVSLNRFTVVISFVNCTYYNF